MWQAHYPDAGSSAMALRCSSLAIWLLLAASGAAALVYEIGWQQQADEAKRPDTRLIERAGLAMGSELKLTAWTWDDRVAQATFDEVFSEFDRLDRLMSVWKDGSDILRLNAAAGDHPVRVSPETFEALRMAHDVSVWTDGRFDVTFGALTDVWRIKMKAFRRQSRSAPVCRSSTIDHSN
jgi:thiamine biosynthesis lipoprotein ApbE